MTADPVRIVAAAAIAAIWVLLWAVTAWLARRRAAGPAGPSKETILVVFASQTGFAEELARATAAGLMAAGTGAEAVGLGGLSAEALMDCRRALFVVATTGEGDAPDAAARFVRSAMRQRRNLSQLEAGVLALGDRRYENYCAFGRRLESWLADSGARPLFDRIEVNAGDAASLADWRRAVGSLAGSALPELAQSPSSDWRIGERTVLNPYGAGDPAFLIALLPPTEVRLDWAAGDVVEIERVVDGVAHHREYSIASLPGDGRIELVVRRHRRNDGTTGLMSGWLTAGAPLGQAIPLRVRCNSSFHSAGDGAAVLIGSGTGIAGLRAHLKARAARGCKGAWLIYGERTHEGDFLLGREIAAMAEQGVIGRLDLAFSRDGDAPRYVQHVLAACAEDLRAAVRQGAALYVCGSRMGMGQEVHRTLAEILGAEALERLNEAGRYRRDVY